MPNFQYGIAGLSQGVLSGNDKPTKPKGNKNIFSQGRVLGVSQG